MFFIYSPYSVVPTNCLKYSSRNIPFFLNKNVYTSKEKLTTKMYSVVGAADQLTNCSGSRELVLKLILEDLRNWVVDLMFLS